MTPARAAEPESRLLRVLAVAYWLTFAVVAEPTMSPPDGFGYYAYAQSLLKDGDLSIAQELQVFGIWDGFGVTARGYARNLFALGTGLLWLPFIAVAFALSWIGKTVGLPLSTEGVGLQYLYALCFATAVYGFLALCLSYRCVRRFAPARQSLLAVTAIALFSPFFYYAFFAASCSHVPAAFCVALLLYVRFVRAPSSPRDRAYHAVLGACAGLCALVRWQLATLGLVIGLELWLHCRAAGERRPWGGAAAYFTSAALVFAPQCIVWWLQFGTPLVVPQGGGFLRALDPMIWSLMFSSHHGLFTWAPVLLLGALGIAWLALGPRAQRETGWLLVALLLPQLYVCSIAADVFAGASFGMRRLVALSPLFAIGLAVLLTRLPRLLTTALLVGCGAWTTSLMLAFKWRVLHESKFVTWDQLVSAAAHSLEAAPTHLLQPPPHLGFAWLLISTGGAGVGLALCGLAALAALAVGLSRLLLRGGELAMAVIARAAVAAAAIALCGVALAATRSAAAPVPAVVARGQALLDFTTYANSRYDNDPYLPLLTSLTRAPDLLGPHRWGDVPFHIAPPAGGRNAAPSVVSTCSDRGRDPEIEIALRPQPSRALHLAVTGRSLGPTGRSLQPGKRLVSVDVEYAQGTIARHQLRSRTDIRDFFAAVPPERVAARSMFGAIQGVTIPLDGPPTRVRLGRRNVEDRHCIALFALTQETLTSAGHVPIDLSEVANANHGVDFFLPQRRVNHFPSLPGGVMRSGPDLFWVREHLPRPAAGNALTTALIPGYRQRLPLHPATSERLSLLIDGKALPTRGTIVAQLTVEYDRGAPSVHSLRSGIDVADYERTAAAPIAWRGPPPQDLTRHNISLDRTRRPRFLWIEASATPQRGAASAVAVLAITQHLAH